MKYIFTSVAILIFSFVSSNLVAQDEKPLEFQHLGIMKMVKKYKNGLWTDKEIAVMDAHFLRLLEFREKRKVMFSGSTQYENGHDDLQWLIVFYAEDIEAAHKFMKEDPAVKAGIMTYTVHSFHIAIGDQ